MTKKTLTAIALAATLSCGDNITNNFYYGNDVNEETYTEDLSQSVL